MKLPLRLFKLLTGQPLRSAEAQRQVDEASRQLILYQFPGCPYCLKVRWRIRQLQLDIPLRDALNDPTHKQALMEGGKRFQTPCLRIEQDTGEAQWMYESDDIIRYLEQRFG